MYGVHFDFFLTQMLSNSLVTVNECNSERMIDPGTSKVAMVFLTTGGGRGVQLSPAG